MTPSTQRTSFGFVATPLLLLVLAWVGLQYGNPTLADASGRLITRLDIPGGVLQIARGPTGAADCVVRVRCGVDLHSAMRRSASSRTLSPRSFSNRGQSVFFCIAGTREAAACDPCKQLERSLLARRGPARAPPPA